MGGGMWGMVAQMALQEYDKEKQDRMALYYGLKEAADDNSYIMAHYPGFYSTPQVSTQAVGQTTQNAPSNMAGAFSGAMKQYSDTQQNNAALKQNQGQFDAKMAYDKEQSASSQAQFDKWMASRGGVSNDSGYAGYMAAIGG
jgi:hypothetical protein